MGAVRVFGLWKLAHYSNDDDDAKRFTGTFTEIHCHHHNQD